MRQHPKRKLSRVSHLALGACVGTALLTGGSGAFAQDSRVDKLEKENADLKKRLDSLEGLALKEGMVPSGAKPLVKALSEIQLSGFVQASYFYSTGHPDDGYSDGYLWNTKDNSFSLNKVKLTLNSKPVATDKWDAGFRTSLMFGEDAPQLNTPGGNGTTGGNSTFNDVREAYVELNVPIGTGLNIKAGEMISLLNYESGDGGAANVNFSQGNQWWFTGNGPSAGVQAAYNFTDKVGLVARVDNGLFQGPVDNNKGKAYSFSLNLKPTSKFWMNVYGFYDFQPNENETRGFGSIGGLQVTEKLGTGFEVDYFNFWNSANSSDLYSVGGWVWYDFTSKVGVAFRGDYVYSPDGTLGPAIRPGAGLSTTESDGSLASLTLTLNWKPVPNIKIQPEARVDFTSYKNGFDGKDCPRLTLGMGASYMF